MAHRKLIELLVGDGELLPIEAISLVHDPAIEEKWVAFSKGQSTRMVSFAAVDEDKRTLIGPALIPDKHIPRFDEKTDEEYDVFFSQDTVKLASELYMKNNRTNEHTLEHQKPVDGVHVVESWIVEDPDMDKSKAYGLSMPKGTWMVRVHVANDEMWGKVKAGEIRGFSIEGYFIDSVVEMGRKQLSESSMKAKLWDTVKSLFSRRKFYTEVSLEDGAVIATEDDTMGPGSSVVMIDAQGQPVDLKNGKYKTQAGIELEAYDGILVEYDGEVQAVEETQNEVENDDKTELNADKVQFYKAYMKAKMRKEFGFFQEKTYNTAMSKSSKNKFMSELERMGFHVGEFGTDSQRFYDEGGFDISAEMSDRKLEPLSHWLDYYGEFRGGYQFVHPDLEKMADDYGYYFEWYNAAILSVAPKY